MVEKEERDKNECEEKIGKKEMDGKNTQDNWNIFMVEKEFFRYS